ncbi:MAG: hypothetical protein A2792_03505 [Sphingomonadales bacterium RIFCSPHIGHO2_01_FULL_65_20]|nr:MAG: hypothetical protein A2792_03505 [Sphingomonadales bacterium RIFCSPHIGHO2_01_FULL_65_20]
MPRTRRGCKPMLGYRTKTEAAYALFSQGLTLSEIAERMGDGSDNKTIDALIYHACKSHPERFAVAHVPITETVLSMLRPAAAKRGVDAETLAARLVWQVIAGGLVDAVLDDGGENG